MKLPCGFGRYTLVERIARGGTAEIYRATLESLEGFRKTVAIKRLLSEWSGCAELARMLKDEGRVLCHLPHQSIVQVYEMGVEQGLPYLAMEFVHGIDGARLINRLMRDRRPMPAQHALYAMEQVLTALAFAHSAFDEEGRRLGIVHRDVSPSNVLLSFQGEVKLTDFGIAKGAHRSERTDAGQIRGKHCYMSPEQARGEAIDARTDIFACGIVLYEMLTARRLFGGACDYEVLRRVAEGGVVLEGAGGLSHPLRMLLERSLARDRDERYPTAEAVLSDLKGAARGLGGPGSSVELARFVCELFPEELARDRCAAASMARTERTRIMTAPSACGRPAVRRVAWRTAAMVALLAAATAFARPIVVPASRPSPPTPPREGAPRVEGAAVEAKPAHARLSVGARPWGLVTVPGYVRASEAPLRGLRVRPGKITVSVEHPPSGQRAARSVLARPGRTTRCTARFGATASIDCR